MTGAAIEGKRVMTWDRSPRVCWICGAAFSPIQVTQKKCRDDPYHHSYEERWHYWHNAAYRKRVRKNNRKRARARYWRDPELARAKKRRRYWANREKILERRRWRRRQRQRTAT
jgi:hypothetical protein